MDETAADPRTLPRTETHDDVSRPRPARTSRSVVLACTVGALVLVLGAAWALTQMTGSTAKVGDGVERTDVVSVAERLPALAEATSATWYSGWYSGWYSTLAPGEHSLRTWMDVVVDLPEGRGAELKAQYGAAELDHEPEVSEELHDRLPGTPLHGCEALDAAFSTDYWHATAYLSVETDTLVLVVEGWADPT